MTMLMVGSYITMLVVRYLYYNAGGEVAILQCWW